MANKLALEHQQIMDEDEGVIRRLFERVYSKGELNIINEIAASDVIGYCSGTTESYLGPDSMKTHVKQIRATFQGFTINIDQLYVERDAFEVHWTARGSHEQLFINIDPTCNIGAVGEEPSGNRIAVSGVTTGIISNGKIREQKMDWNVEQLCQQLQPDVTGDSSERIKKTPYAEWSL